MFRSIVRPLQATTTKAFRRFSFVSAVLALFVASMMLAGPAAAAQVTDISSTYTFKPLRIGAGGFVTGLITHPRTSNLVYARTDTSGAYIWNETSQNWSQLLMASNVPNPGLGSPADYEVDSIAVSAQNDQVVYVSVGQDTNGRMLKSTNRGQTWTDSGQRWYVNGNGDYRQGGERIAVDPNNDSIVYFGSRTQGLWVSTNAGSSWSQVSTSSVPVGSNPSGTAVGVKFVLFDPNSTTKNGATQTIYVGVAGKGIYRSLDGGASWQLLLAATSIVYDGKLAADGSLWVSFAATEPNGSLQRYVPSSNQWANVSPSGSDTWAIAVDPFNAQRVIVAPGGPSTSGGFYRTTNAGSGWTNLSCTLTSTNIPWVTTTDEYQYLSVGTVRFDSTVQNRLWFGEGLAAWRTADESGSSLAWSNVSVGIENPIATDVIAPNGVAVTGIYDREGFYHSNPDGFPATTHIDTIGTNGPQLFGGTSLDYSTANTNFMALAEVQNNGGGDPIRGGYSTNGGSSFQVFGSYPAVGTGGNIAVSATNTSNIVWLPSTANFGSGNPPYYSTNQGASWKQSSGISSVRTHIFFYLAGKKALDSDKVTGGKFYVITDDPVNSSTGGKFYVSTDGGATYALAPNSPVCSTNDNCHVFGQLRAVPGKANNVWSTDPTNGLYYTTDAGQTSWVKVANVQSCYGIGFGKAASGASYPAVYIAGTISGQRGIFRSIDQGSTWQYLTDNPIGIYNQIVTINGDLSLYGRVYVGFNGNGFAYGDVNTAPAQDKIVSSTFPSSVTPVGTASITIQYTTSTSRTLKANLWDSNWTWEGSVSQAVSGSGSVVLSIPYTTSIATSTAYARVDLTDGTNVLDTASNYSIPVQTASDTITSVTWPSSISPSGPANATVQYSAAPGRTLVVTLWDSNWVWKGQTTQTVSGNGSVAVSVTANASISTSTAYMRADLMNGSTVLSEVANYTIPVH